MTEKQRKTGHTSATKLVSKNRLKNDLNRKKLLGFSQVVHLNSSVIQAWLMWIVYVWTESTLFANNNLNKMPNWK